MKKILLPLLLAALAGTPVFALGAHPDDLVSPDQFYSEFNSRARQADTAYETMERAARAVLEASRSCTAGQGAADACAGVADARAFYQRTAELYKEAEADVTAWRGHLKTSVDEATSEGCDDVWFEFRRRNCRANLERYQGYLGAAGEREQGLASRAAGLAQAIERATALAARHQGAAATHAERQAAAARTEREQMVQGLGATELGNRIAQCRLSQNRGADCAGDLPQLYREAYQAQTGVAVGPDQMPPVRTLEEACAAWGSATRVPPVHGREICEPGALDGLTRDDAQQKILVFLRNGPGRRIGCNSAVERCLPTDFDEAGEAARITADLPEGERPEQVVAGDTGFQQATDIATDIARRETNRQTALDTVLAGGGNDPVQCQGGSNSMFGLGVQCGDAGELGQAGTPGEAPSFVPTNLIADQNVLGNGAVVMRGDTLGHIAQDVRRQLGRSNSEAPLWGQGGLVDLLAAANGTADPNVLHPQDGVRVPTMECLGEALDASDAEARQVLSDCEALVRVSGVPENLSVALRMARERVARLEADRGEPFPDSVRQEILMDAANTAASPASDFAGVGPGIPAADFIRSQTERFGEDYRALITQVANDAEARGYNDDERFRLLNRRLRELQSIAG